MTRLALVFSLGIATLLHAETPPPIPGPPTDPLPPVRPAALDTPVRDTPAQPRAATGSANHASELFAQQQYAQATRAFAEAERGGQPLTAKQRDEWAYCRLHAIAVRLNSGQVAAKDRADMQVEIEQALRSGSERLAPFARQLTDEMKRRYGADVEVKPGKWETLETASFRIHHRGAAAAARDVAQTAEAARRAMYERWAGPPAGDWTPRCDVYLHNTSADYALATAKPPESPGHATLAIKGERVVSRRIDVRLDDSEFLDRTVPSEVTVVLLGELFAEQPLPRWAVIGIAALAESPESVARYRRAVPGLLNDKKLFPVGPFLEKLDFAEPASMTAFYAESVSLVCYLVELRGPRAFMAFLREAPRRGYAKALASHYGIKDPAELQERWVRHSLGGD